jgi:PAS domain S-box-containing protein
MKIPPDDGQSLPGAPNPPDRASPPGDASRVDDSPGARVSPSGSQPNVAAAPSDALARLLDRRASAEGPHTEALLRALVDASPLAMWVLDPEGRVVLWNAAAERLTGWSAGEVLGRFVPIVPPDKISDFHALFGRALRKESVVDAEVRRQKKDGSPIDLSLSNAPLIAPDGAVVAVLVMAADLTARKEAEETARRLASERAAREAADAARKRLEGIVESISDGYAAFDREWRYTYVNGRYGALVRQTGKDPGALIGRVVWEVFPETVGTKFHTEALRAVREGQPVEFDEYYPPLDQTFNVRVFPTPDGIVSITRDVSERRRAERALEQSESRFRSLAEASTQIVWTTDPEGRIISPVPQWTALTAQPSSAALGYGMLDAVHPDDRPEVQRLWREAIASKRPFSATFRLRVADGSYRWFAARGVPVLNSDGSVREWVGTSSDIDERKRVEAEREQLLAAERAARERTEKLQSVTAALVEAVTVKDVADRVVETVRATTTSRSASLSLLTADGSEFEVIRTTGLPEELAAKWRRYPADPAYPTTHAVRTGEPVFLRSVDEMRERFPKLVDNALAYGFAATAVLPLVVGGTTVGTLGLNYATPQPFDTGKRAYLAAVAQQCAQALERARLFEAERSARAEAEGARRDADAARADAEQASRAKSDFLATMSHELRTPLNAIIGYQSLLADGVTGPVTDGQRRQLERIGSSANHLLMLIDEVLTLSRVEAGKESLHAERVDVARILDEAATIIEPLAKQKQLDFKVVGPATPIVIETDAGKVRQAVLNLLSNAVKFTGRGSITLTVWGADDAVSFQVRDTGIGIAAEHLERIFDPFWQVEASTTRTAPGTGLGLAVTRRLAHLLGGEVTVQSALGEGSTFTLRLPRAPAPSQMH